MEGLLHPVQDHGQITNDFLYEKQMALLSTFLKHGAISREQYTSSAGELTWRMKHRTP